MLILRSLAVMFPSPCQLCCEDLVCAFSIRFIHSSITAWDLATVSVSVSAGGVEDGDVMLVLLQQYKKMF